ncbi:MAG: Hsp33 family molecular chaperone HslO, partial [Sphingomonadales bacterium]|nr:Hsp33 family molecular chaperone HslO [Sphingomonadales bacterium]
MDSKNSDADNIVKPFQVEGENIEADVRGRATRLGTVLEQILSAHDYPEIVAQTLGEVLVLTATLGSMLKFEGTLTIQAKADGIIKMLVADYKSSGDNTAGELRGYADVDYE